MKPMIATAFENLARGFWIFPCQPLAKTPAVRGAGPYTIRWSECATSDPDTVIRLWNRWPEANVGIACKQSGLFVVDCDIPKEPDLLAGTPWEYLHGIFGPYVDGETLLDQVAERYGGSVADFDTYSVRTTRKGLHCYYRWPDGVQASQSSIVRGVLDVRGNGGTRGGYVLGAGSRTDGGPYVLERDVPIRPAPEWLVSLCTERPKPKPVHPGRAPQVGQDGFPVGPANFAGLVATVANAPEGNRNNALLWAARAMCADGAPVGTAEEILIPATPLGEREARQTIRSAYRLQGRQ